MKARKGWKKATRQTCVGRSSQIWPSAFDTPHAPVSRSGAVTADTYSSARPTDLRTISSVTFPVAKSLTGGRKLTHTHSGPYMENRPG